MRRVLAGLRSSFKAVLYPFHVFGNVIGNVSFMGLSSVGKELLLTLMVHGELPLNYVALANIISTTLKTRPHSTSTLYVKVRDLAERELIVVDEDRGIIRPTVKGLAIAGKYVVLVRMIYTVPMTIALLLLLTILRPWTPWWFLYAATSVAILHHVCNLIMLFLGPVEGVSSRVNGLIRLLPEVLPIALFLTSIWRRIADPVRASVEVLDLKTMEVRRKIVKILMVPVGYLRLQR